MSTLASLKNAKVLLNQLLTLTAQFHAELNVLGIDGATGQETWVTRYYCESGHKLACFMDMTKKRPCPELDLNVAMVPFFLRG